MKRREFFKVTTAFAVGVSGGCARHDDTRTAAASDAALLSLTSAQAVSAIRRGDISAESYAAALLARAERLRDLNACISIDRNGLMEGARRVDAERTKGGRLGPVAGLPLLVKDNIDSAALPTTAGCRGLAQNRPKLDAPVLRQLLSGGALLMAKANMHELAMGVTSNNATYGAVKNPYDPRMIAGGSSGGTGAGIAARIAPAGLGTDTGGSVRIPAALCGIVGLRPSVGNGKKRYSTQGVVPLSHTRDTVGPMGRTVGDIALLDSVITGEPMAQPVPLKGLRLGVPRTAFWEDVDGDVSVVAESALRRLKAAGAVLIEINIGPVRDFNPGRAITLYELRGDLEAYLTAGGSGITVDDVLGQVASRDATEFLADAKSVDKRAYDAALNGLRPQLQKIFADGFNQHALDAMVFPTTPLPARLIKQGGDSRSDTVLLNGRQVSTFQTYARNTTLDSAAGLPGLSVPIGITPTGLPVGLEFSGPVNSDRTLLGIGMSAENEFGVLPAPKL
jgi:indoleacetamide hydrolase